MNYKPGRISKRDFNAKYKELQQAMLHTPEKYEILLSKALEAGFPIDFIPRFNKYKSTLLYEALKNNAIYLLPIQQLHLKLGASVNVIDKFGRNALITAVLGKQNIDLIKTIIDKTADLNLRDGDEANHHTALDYAVWNYILNPYVINANLFENTVKILLEAGADPNLVQIKNRDFEFVGINKANTYKRLDYIKHLLFIQSQIHSETKQKNTMTYEYEL